MNRSILPSAVRQRLLAHVGSLRTALALMLLLGLVALLRPDAPSLTVVFGALGANLLAALVVHPLLRRRLPLLVFHVALLALVLLAGFGRLAALDGRFELTQGVPFDGQLIEQHAGALHAGPQQQREQFLVAQRRCAVGEQLLARAQRCRKLLDRHGTMEGAPRIPAV